MWEEERRFQKQGFKLIAGIDEAGRGPLAGPVVAAAVILADQIPGVNDSKLLTEKKREALFEVILQQAVAIAVGVASVEEIEEINILNATFLAMDRAWKQLKPTPELLLIDGNRYKGEAKQWHCLVQGDQRSGSIAAASIVAKVTRDRMMRELDLLYPEYGFAQHKGYATAVHRHAIATYGPLPIHRSSFLTSINGQI